MRRRVCACPGRGPYCLPASLATSPGLRRPRARPRDHGKSPPVRSGLLALKKVDAPRSAAIADDGRSGKRLLTSLGGCGAVSKTEAPASLRVAKLTRCQWSLSIVFPRQKRAQTHARLRPGAGCNCLVHSASSTREMRQQSDQPTAGGPVSNATRFTHRLIPAEGPKVLPDVPLGRTIAGQAVASRPSTRG